MYFVNEQKVTHIANAFLVTEVKHSAKITKEGGSTKDTAKVSTVATDKQKATGTSIVKTGTNKML